MIPIEINYGIPNLFKALSRSHHKMKGETLPSKVLKILSAEYCITIFLQRQITNADQMHDTISYLIEYDRGKLILRVYVKKTCRNRILYEHSLLRHLFCNKLKVAQPLTIRNGDTFIEIEGTYYAIFPFISGHHYVDYCYSKNSKLNYIHQAGESLGRFHSLVKNYKPEGDRSWHDFRETLLLLEKYYEITGSQAHTDDLNRFFLDNYFFLKDSLLELGELFSSSNLIPKCIIHEDFGAHNLLYKNGKLSGILDFMDAHFDWRAKDVIFSLWSFSETKKSVYDEDRVRVFLEGYQKFCEITAEEIDSMPDLFCLKKLNELPNCLMAYFADDENKIKYHRLFVRFVEAIQLHRQKKEILREKLKKYIR